MLAIYSTTITDIKITIANCIIFYILSFYLIQIPHEFIHTLFYKNPFKNTNNNLVFFNNKRIITSELNEEISPTLLIFNLIMPFITLLTSNSNLLLLILLLNIIRYNK